MYYSNSNQLLWVSLLVSIAPSPTYAFPGSILGPPYLQMQLTSPKHNSANENLAFVRMGSIYTENWVDLIQLYCICRALPKCVSNTIAEVDKISVVLEHEVPSVEVHVSLPEHISEELLLWLQLISSIAQKGVQGRHGGNQDACLPYGCAYIGKPVKRQGYRCRSKELCTHTQTQGIYQLNIDAQGHANTSLSRHTLYTYNMCMQKDNEN